MSQSYFTMHNALPEHAFHSVFMKKHKICNCCRCHIKAINMEFNLVNKIIKHSAPHCDISVPSHAYNVMQTANQTTTTITTITSQIKIPIFIVDIKPVLLGKIIVKICIINHSPNHFKCYNI